MKARYYLGGIVIVIFLGLLVYNFTQTDIEYESNFSTLMQDGKTCKATGTWIRDKAFEENRADKTFSFFIRDAHNNEMKVVYKGIKPNNFEVATSVVVTGKFENGYFNATDVLTKCPSKYEGQPTTVGKPAVYNF
ncbi:MAG: cytochrome c maturation protein CcmE [Bacteroidetes bacterium]|nr:cytochrome c maturation protein CcmE [Bacteroidota bacterium]